MGEDEASNIVYVFDYGLSKPFCNFLTGEHIMFTKNNQLTGTPRYASINVHMGYEQSRRDDLESLCYTLIYLMKHKLPWQGLKDENELVRYAKIMEIKKSISVPELCKGLPMEISNFLNYSRSLSFEAKPDYETLKKSFRMYLVVKGVIKFVEDWVKRSSLVERGSSTSLFGRKRGETPDKKPKLMEEKINLTIAIKEKGGRKITKAPSILLNKDNKFSPVGTDSNLAIVDSKESAVRLEMINTGTDSIVFFNFS